MFLKMRKRMLNYMSSKIFMSKKILNKIKFFNIKNICLFIFFNLINSNIAFAYLEPGTGSLIITFIVSIIAYISATWTKIKLKFREFIEKNKKKNNDNI